MFSNKIHVIVFSDLDVRSMPLQMGGAAGVRAAEAGNLTIQTKEGLRMHCVSRALLG